MINVYGEALIDLVPNKPEQMAPLQPTLGGGPFNTAIAAARLGGKVRFLSRISTDNFGTTITNTLAEENIDISHLERGEEPTTLAITNIDNTGTANYTFYTAGTADRYAKPPTPSCNIASFGTLSLHLEPAATRYAATAKQLHQEGTLIALDPNIRPIFATPDRKDALLEFMEHTHILKLSDEEIDFLGGLDVITQVPVCIITHGSKGIEAYTPAGHITVPSPQVNVVDTIGAGDTVMGALLAWLDRTLENHNTEPLNQLRELDNAQWKQALSFAARAAAITCSRAGAQPPSLAKMQEA